MYLIHAQNLDGKRVKILSEDALHKRMISDLELQKFRVLSVSKLTWWQEKVLAARRFYIKRSKINIAHQRFFSAEMATMLQAGATIQEALLQVLVHSANFRLSQAIYGAYQKILQGYDIQDAFLGYPKIFTPVFLAFLKQAILTGKLGPAFSQFSDYCEYASRSKRAFNTYILPLVFAIGFCWSFAYVAKNSLLKGFLWEARVLGHAKSIWLQIFEQTSPWLLSYRVVATIILVPMLVSFILSRKWIVRVPVLNKRIMLMARLQFTKVLIISFKTGNTLQEAFKIGQKILDHSYYKETVQKALEHIARGGSKEEAIRKTQLFSATHERLIVNCDPRSSLIENLEIILEYLESELRIWDAMTSQIKRYSILAVVSFYITVTGLAILYGVMGWV